MLLSCLMSCAAKHYDTAEKSVKAVGGGSMITEFGAVGDGIPSAEAIDALGDLADTHTQSWAYWTFKGFNDITTQVRVVSNKAQRRPFACREACRSGCIAPVCLRACHV